MTKVRLDAVVMAKVTFEGSGLLMDLLRLTFAHFLVTRRPFMLGLSRFLRRLNRKEHSSSNQRNLNLEPNWLGEIPIFLVNATGQLVLQWY